MPGLDQGIHVFAASKEGVDGRIKPGHDEAREHALTSIADLPIAPSDGRTTPKQNQSGR